MVACFALGIIRNGLISQKKRFFLKREPELMHNNQSLLNGGINFYIQLTKYLPEKEIEQKKAYFACSIQHCIACANLPVVYKNVELV